MPNMNAGPRNQIRAILSRRRSPERHALPCNPVPASLFSGYLKSGVKRKVALRDLSRQ